MKKKKNIFYIKLLIVLAFFITGHFGCLSQNYPEKVKLRKIKILDSKIDSLLSIVVKFTEDHCLNDYYILLYVIEQDKDYAIDISIQSKKAIAYAYHFEGSSIQGFYEVNNHNILVVGEFYPLKMKFLDKAKTYTFLNQWKKTNKNNPPPPPPMSNPIVFDFLLKENGNVILLK